MNPGFPPSSSLAPGSPEPGDALWQSCLDQLAQELPEQQFNTWIRPLQAEVTPDLSKVRITVGNRFKLDWIRAQYTQRLSQLLAHMSGQSVQVELVLAQRETVSRYVQQRIQVDSLFFRQPLFQILNDPGLLCACAAPFQDYIVQRHIG